MLVILTAIVYTFRDSAAPILEQLKKTTPEIIAGICIMTVIYHVIEGFITTVLAREYNPEFTWKMGIGNAFFCSFYRVATLGSGAGVAAIVYLGDHGVEYFCGFGLYMLQYAFHKISMVLFSIFFFVVSWNYMYQHFASYLGLLAGGYAITVVITIFLILFCCSVQFHKLLYLILDFLDRITKGRLKDKTADVREQCGMLEAASKHLLKKKRLVVGVIMLNMLKFCFWYGIPYLIFATHSEVTLAQTMAVTSLSIMLAAVIPAPAGIGSTEWVFTALFSEIVGAGMAGMASLLYRFGTFVFPFMVGAVVVIIRRVKSERHLRGKLQ